MDWTPSALQAVALCWWQPPAHGSKRTHSSGSAELRIRHQSASVILSSVHLRQTGHGLVSGSIDSRHGALACRRPARHSQSGPAAQAPSEEHHQDSWTCAFSYQASVHSVILRLGLTQWEQHQWAARTGLTYFTGPSMTRPAVQQDRGNVSRSPCTSHCSWQAAGSRCPGSHVDHLLHCAQAAAVGFD